MNISPRRILVLAPHTDDGEFGCGASLSRFEREGAVIFYAAFSTAEESVPDGFPKNILETEVRAATKQIGIKSENVFLYRYPVRRFTYQRQDILEDLVKLQKQIQPDLVFLPSRDDIHQDHATITVEGIRAFKRTTILGYELPWNNLRFEMGCFITVKEEDVKRKLNALNEYNSQKHRSYASEEYVRALALTRGVQIGSRNAEVFELLRLIVSD